jgi:hypothetical protein
MKIKLKMIEGVDSRRTFSGLFGGCFFLTGNTKSDTADFQT